MLDLSWIIEFLIRRHRGNTGHKPTVFIQMGPAAQHLTLDVHATNVTELCITPAMPAATETNDNCRG